MKYLLTIMIICMLSCKKDNITSNSQNAKDPSATSLSCKTIYSSPSVPNIYWSVTFDIPDTNTVIKLSFKRVSPSYTAFEIDKPLSKSYTLIQRGYACPSYNDNAKFYYEWQMSDGSIKSGTPFQVWEQ